MVKTTSSKIGDWIIAVFCIILILVCFLPVLNILSRSLSAPLALVSKDVTLLPKQSHENIDYEYYPGTNGANATETTVTVTTLRSGVKKADVETYVVREVFSERTQEMTTTLLKIGETKEYVKNIHGTVEADKNTGTILDEIIIGEVQFVNDYNPATGLGTLVLENADLVLVNIIDLSEEILKENVVLEFTLNEETGEIERETLFIREVTDKATGETSVIYIPMSEAYNPRLYHKTTRIDIETGTNVDSLHAYERVFFTNLSMVTNNTTGEEVEVGTLILKDSEIRKVVSSNTSKLGIDLTAYEYVFKDSRYTWSLAWTAMLTVACALWSVFMTAICAYPLTYDHLKGRKFFNTMIILTMYFGAGTIPTYMLLKSLGLINQPLVLALPFCLSVFNMIIMRSYFYGIPLSLRESAELDGAGPIKTMLFIYIPLSMPVIATLLLFYAVGRWNGYSDAMMFMDRNRHYYPIQYLLYVLIQGIQQPDVQVADPGANLGVGESIKMAMVMFAMLPILIIYPLLQRYFISGVTLGAVKE
ncbi:MAG: carbohydrate ABC transporter permease [Oscillospiraceae bacterium]|nr:carbohydrate ABC transporter permease [Oscillospiraceae bacterium]